MWKVCEKKNETSLHILCSCESFPKLGEQYFVLEQFERNKMDEVPIGIILDYVDKTGLLEEWELSGSQ